MTKEKIYIILSHSGTIVSKAIKRVTHKPYSHVSIALDKELSQMYSFGRIYKYSPIPGGFVIENFKSGFYEVFKETECSIYELEITKEQKEKLTNNLKEFKQNQKEYGYNILGLLTAYVDIPLERQKSYFCSQFIAYILNKSDINLVDKPPGITEPMDFIENNKNIKLMYEGKISELCMVTGVTN